MISGVELEQVAPLIWPAGKALPADDLPAWLDKLAALAAKSGAAPLADLATAAVRDPDSPDRLYDLGYALIDAGAPHIAATVLWRCLALVGDSEEVLCELVSALETALAYRDAFQILEDHPALRARSFLCSYLYAFNAAMSGRLDVARAELPRLSPQSTENTMMRDSIGWMIGRADRIAGASPLDANDLRGWQYVLTGSLLAHQSPHGFAGPMRGRYAWLQDSHDRIATGLDRLRELVAPMQLPCIYAPPGRGHEIVAAAAAERLGLPVAPWPAVGTPAPGLIVMYDLTELGLLDMSRLVQRRAEQILYAHASPWTKDFPIAADVTMLLYQSLVPPWSADDGVDHAKAIAASPGLQAIELTADQPERWQALVARAWPPEPGIRTRLWAGGPVASNRFV